MVVGLRKMVSKGDCMDKKRWLVRMVLGQMEMVRKDGCRNKEDG